MARTFKLNDLQLILLSSAARRSDGSLLPPPETVEDQAARIHKAITALLHHSLVDEVPVTGEAQLWRREGDIMFGLVINNAGRGMIGAETDALPMVDDPVALIGADVQADGGVAADEAGIPTPPSNTKTAAVLALLARGSGASIDQLVAATGWLPHSTRAALTGLRKKGHAVTRFKRDEITCYRIAEVS